MGVQLRTRNRVACDRPAWSGPALHARSSFFTSGMLTLLWAPLALLLAGALVLGGQSRPPSPLIEGNVFSVSGEPVRKATVRLEGTGEHGIAPARYSRVTDDEGNFVFEDVTPDSYLLSAEKPGFLTQRFGAVSDTAPGTLLKLDAGQSLKNLVIKLNPQAVVAGLITDLDGDPLPGARVTVLKSSYVRNRRQLSIVSTASSNEAGEFRAGNLAPGRYYLAVTDARAARRRELDRTIEGAGGEVNVTTYYPNSLEPSGAAPVDVQVGEDLRGLNIQIQRARVYSIRGRVIDAATGTPATNTLLSIGPAPESPRGSATLLRSVQLPRMPDATFESRDLLPGTYLIQALPRAMTNVTQGSMVAGRMEVPITDSDVDGAVLMLSPVVEINGRITLEGGDIKELLQSSQNIAQFRGTFRGPIAAVRPMVALRDTESAGLPSLSAQTRDDGTFRIEGAAPSNYFVAVSGLPETANVKTVRFGLRDVTHAPLELASAGSATLDIVLSTKAGNINGIVRNSRNEPLHGALVTLWTKDPDPGNSTGGISTVYSDPNGTFRFTGIAPGDYYLAAWENDVSSIIQNTDFRSHFQTRASAIRLLEDTHISMDPQVIRSDEIRAEAAAIP
jgi:protocatechuate 3,4-dioxygenase beta subunit